METMPGGWQLADLKACSLPQDVATAFSKVVDKIVGAEYVPVLYCGFQVVSGKNHMIMCKQTLVTNPPEDHLVKVVMYVPLKGDPLFTSIERIL